MTLPPSEQLAALRILDANYNRASEGLRVLEEYCRFGLNDRHLAERCKRMRHAVASAFLLIPETQRQAARDTQADVGVELTTEQEALRESLQAVAAAGWGRVEQALRVIEEYGKLVSVSLAEQAKILRYEAYTLAKACLTTAESQSRLIRARLYVLIDGGESRETLRERVSSLVAAGVNILQLRDKNLADRELLARARIVREETTGTPTLFILNDRPDLAVLSRADGVHVGQEELSVADVRRIVGHDLLVGVSTHSIEQARQAVLDGANYIGCGPTFPSGTKQFAHFPGLDFLRQVAAEISLPAFAIGGITLESLSGIFAAGFQRIAVSQALRNLSTLRTNVAAFLAAVEGSDASR